MSSATFDAINKLIATSRQHRQHVLGIPKNMEAGMTPNEVMRRDFELRRDLVHAAKEISSTAPDAEAEKAIGPMLLERIVTAVDTRTQAEWDALAQAALDLIELDDEASHDATATWMTESKPIVELADEAEQRAQDQGTAVMVEGMRQGVEKTPGFDLRFTEIVNGQVVTDEQMFGPTPGEEDSPEVGTGRLELSKQSLLGLDDDITHVEVERVIVRESKQLLERNGLKPTVSSTDVANTVSERVRCEALRDAALATITGEVPDPIEGLDTSHFPALRLSLLQTMYQILTSGSLHSRAERGDRSAQSTMHELIVIADMLVSSDPYFLPVNEIADGPADAPTALEPSRRFLVWHDEPLPVAGDLRVLTWLFSTNEQGRIDDIVRVVMVSGDRRLDDGWCSLTNGPASTVAQAVAATLTERSWDTTKRLRLPGEPNSREWTKELRKSKGRARRGGVHRVRTLSDS